MKYIYNEQIMLNNFNAKYYSASSFSQAWKLTNWLSENRSLIMEKCSVSETPCIFRRYNAENRDVRTGGTDICRNCREAVFRDRYTAACPNRGRPVIGNRANYLVRKVLKQMSRSYTGIPVSGDRLVSPGDHNSYNISLGSLSSSTAAATNLLFDL